MRIFTLVLALATCALPFVAAVPGAHLSLPTEGAAFVGVSVSAGPVRVEHTVAAVPAVALENPAAAAGVGPSRVATADLSAAVASGASPETASETSLLVPIPLLPDGMLFLGAGAYDDDEGFGERFAGQLVVLPRGASPVLVSQARASPASAVELAHGGDETGAPSLDHAMPVSPVDEGASRAVPARAADERVETQAAAPATTPSASATSVAVAASVGVGLLALLGVALYHRIRPHATLDNDTRKRIFELVCENPGVGVQDVAATASVSYSTATYHLERLVEAGMLVMTPDGNKLCYYKNGGAFTEAERRILPILKNAEAARVLEAIVRAPGTYRSALAAQLGVTTTTINWHLRRLREAGLVDETRQGRSAFLFPTDAGQGCLASLAGKLADRDAEALAVARRCSVSSTAVGAS